MNLSDFALFFGAGLDSALGFATTLTFSITSSATSSTSSTSTSSSSSTSSTSTAFFPLGSVGGDANLYAAALNTSACASTLASNGFEYPPPIVITSGTSRLMHSSYTMWLRRSIPARVIFSLPNESTARASTPAWKYTSRGEYVSKSFGSHSSINAMYSKSPVPSGTSTSWSDRIRVFHG